ncbi:hypothetical protein F2P81_014460 [Scophthalmus maximus]|uniref:PiggyBac transposable element-derived protein domain-containing protein n=1 Tax=Scophthalmus maximus TaxID=52904 RepID=A0A6A4SJX6_SCOMX|nr:hypothetical protein F2P81_014460 [Scophthalmus maximus]
MALGLNELNKSCKIFKGNKDNDLLDIKEIKITKPLNGLVDAVVRTYNQTRFKNDQADNAEHNEEEESTDEEDSASEEEENNDEVIDPTYRPHATSYTEEAPTSPAVEMEEGYEVEENEEHDIEEESEAEMEEGPLEEAVLNMTNKEGRRVYGNKWRKLDLMDLQAYVATYEGAVQDFHHSKLKRKVTLKRSICSATLGLGMGVAKHVLDSSSLRVISRVDVMVVLRVHLYSMVLLSSNCDNIMENNMSQ